MKRSRKWCLTVFACSLLPISIIAQIILAALKSTATLPLEIIVTSVFVVINFYIAGNVLQKKIESDKKSEDK